jgi:hypothetical protein
MKIDAVDTARIPPIKARVITGLEGLELILKFDYLGYGRG